MRGGDDSKGSILPDESTITLENSTRVLHDLRSKLGFQTRDNDVISFIAPPWMKRKMLFRKRIFPSRVKRKCYSKNGPFCDFILTTTSTIPSQSASIMQTSVFASRTSAPTAKLTTITPSISPTTQIDTTTMITTTAKLGEPSNLNDHLVNITTEAYPSTTASVISPSASPMPVSMSTHTVMKKTVSTTVSSTTQTFLNGSVTAQSQANDVVDSTFSGIRTSPSTVSSDVYITTRSFQKVSFMRNYSQGMGLSSSKPNNDIDFLPGFFESSSNVAILSIVAAVSVVFSVFVIIYIYVTREKPQ